MAEISREEYERAINNAEKDADDLRGLIREIFAKQDIQNEHLNKIKEECILLKQRVTDADYISKAYANIAYVEDTKDFKERWDKLGKILWISSGWIKWIGGISTIVALYQYFMG